MQGIFPEILKTAQVSPIHKKEDTVTVSNYHPISLLSVFSKIFEKAMYDRIYSINLVFVQMSQLNTYLLSDCNWTRIQNHLVLKRTLNHLVKLVECSFKN